VAKVENSVADPSQVARCVGIFTTRDLARLLLKGPDLSMPVGKAMSKSVVVATPETTLEDAMKLLAGNDISHLPVAEFVGDAHDQDARISYVLTSNDILAFLLGLPLDPLRPKKMD
jgi:CBS domain-containing protein